MMRGWITRSVRAMPALLLLAATPAAAQGIIMGTMSGWTFSFSGNVNAFIVYTDPKCSDGAPACDFAGNLIPTGTEQKVLRIRTGLAPAFAIFEVKGKEGGLDVGAHIGIAPEIQSLDQLHDNCGTPSGQCGSQIDLREAYLTVGGTWGQLLAGRAIGLYQQQNLLTDMTVFGVGLSGGGAGFTGNGTTLGHIGTGYSYPNFNAQVTYSTPANRLWRLSIGLFDPSVINAENAGVPVGQCCFRVTRSPRLETEVTYMKHTGATGSADKFMFYASGLFANVKNVSAGDLCAPYFGDPTGCRDAVTPWGLATGIEWNKSGVQFDLSGFYQEGVGTAFMFTDGLGVDYAGNRRASYGYLLQLQWMPRDSKWKFGASYGDTDLERSGDDVDNENDFLMKYNTATVGAVTYLWTRSFRSVFEYTYGDSEAYDGTKITSSQGALGVMLFF
jgi:hypothetical protein